MKIKTTRAIFCMAALCALSGAVTAGLRFTSEVYVNDTYRSAGGSMTDARGSAETRQFIGCYHWYDTLGGATPYVGFCQAANSAGLTRSCSSTNYAIVESIRSISAESQIGFSWNADGTCRYVIVTNNSYYKPASATGF
ncbi:MAG: hypothetical protein IT473_07785 [Lysobacter sp.]|nr:hypothetical protein [Lysobacter sp.]